MKMTAITLASVLALASTSALAAEQAPAEAAAPETKPEVHTAEQPKTPSIFEKLDENKDGKISPQEAQVSPALVKGFDKIDANKDGFLSADEFSQLQVDATPARTFVVLASTQAV